MLLTALGHRRRDRGGHLLAFQKRLPRDTVFEWSIIGAGIFARRRGRRSTSAASPRCSSPVVGACAGAAYVTGFTLIQENVTDELRGRTFATLYTVVRLCLLLSLTVSPLFADLYEWLFSLADGVARTSSSAASRYGFPGVRLALWGGGVLTIVSGVYARRELLRYRDLAVQHRHRRPARRAADRTRSRRPTCPVVSA